MKGADYFSKFTRRGFLNQASKVTVFSSLYKSMLCSSLLLSKIADANEGRIGSAPKRLITIHVTNGAHADTWHPDIQGSNFELPQGSAPFEEVRDRCVFIDGLTGEGGHRDYHQCLTNNKKDSLDVYIANKIGEGTAFRSLHFSVAKQNKLSFIDGSPIPFEMNPLAAYERLFSVNSTDDIDFLTNQAIFENNLKQLNALKSSVSVTEQKRLKTHEDSIESLISRLNILHNNDRGSCERSVWSGTKLTLEEMSVDKKDRETVDLRTDLFLELSVMAIKCDLSRVITFSFGDADAEILIPGIEGLDWHNCQHGANNVETNPKARNWFSTKVVSLIKMLENEPDIDGRTLLDNTVIYVTSDMGDGSKHDNLRTPIILAGADFKGGQAIDLNGIKWDPVFDTIIKAMNLSLDDVDYPDYGNGMGVIPGVLY